MLKVNKIVISIKVLNSISLRYVLTGKQHSPFHDLHFQSDFL